MNDEHEAISNARAILAIGPNDDLTLIRKAFRRRSMETHPDRGGSADEFEQVTAAYGLLLESAAEPGADWFFDDPDQEVDVRIVEEESKPRRRGFEEMFLDALRREVNDDNQ